MENGLVRHLDDILWFLGAFGDSGFHQGLMPEGPAAVAEHRAWSWSAGNLEASVQSEKSFKDRQHAIGSSSFFLISSLMVCSWWTGLEIDLSASTGRHCLVAAFPDTAYTQSNTFEDR